MRKLLVVSLIAVASAVLATQALAATRSVKVADDYFVRAGSPPTVTIKKGDTVKWVWSGKHRHNVYQVGGPGHFHSPAHTRTGTFKHKFTTRGTYVFQCTYHLPMKMNVKVK
jgi:plastocyanin